MSRRIGWRLRRKYRPFRMMSEDDSSKEKIIVKKPVNRVIKAKEEAAESYIRHLERIPK